MGRNMTKRLGLIVGVLALAAPSSAHAGTAAWSLVWSDEFQQTDGSPPDPAKWVYDVGGNGWGNNELQTYTSRTNNCRVENGQLILEARAENFTGTDGIPRNYTSARLKTLGKASWTYGRIEGRMKVPRGQGLWPAFWTLGTNFSTIGWPACGEIDIMENIGREPATVYGTIHGPGYSGGGGIGGTFGLSSGAVFADDFHIFAVEWTTNLIRWFVDGQPYFTATPTNLPNGMQWAFTQPQFILLNVAAGGNWPGNPNGTTTFPQRLTVDYVRVYAATNVSECGGNTLTNAGFELGGLANWTTFGAGFNTLLENSGNMPVHGGSNVFKVFGQFTGSENYSGAFRDVPCVAGTTFTADGWAFTPEDDKIAGDNSAWIEVSFREASANILSLYRSAVITTNTTAGGWLNLSVTNQLNPTSYAVIGSTNNLVAPASSAFARYQLVFRQPETAAGSVLFDDLRLWRIGATNSPIQANARKAGDRLAINFPSLLGLDYQIRFKDDLGDSGWQVLTNLSGDGTTQSVSEPLSADRRFYQVIRLCN